ncbi:MAG: hypothetical protein V4736_10135 [Bdellovibrionota bacterium]
MQKIILLFSILATCSANANSKKLAFYVDNTQTTGFAVCTNGAYKNVYQLDAGKFCDAQAGTEQQLIKCVATTAGSSANEYYSKFVIYFVALAGTSQLTYVPYGLVTEFEYFWNEVSGNWKKRLVNNYGLKLQDSGSAKTLTFKGFGPYDGDHNEVVQLAGWKASSSQFYHPGFSIKYSDQASGGKVAKEYSGNCNRVGSFNE